MSTFRTRGRPTDASLVTDALADLADAGRRALVISPDQARELKAITISTLAELRQTRGDTAGQLGPRACLLAGTEMPLDGGQAQYVWDQDSTAADDGEDVVEVTGTPVGRWRRVPTSGAETFTTTGTFAKPTGARLIGVFGVGSGAGGGSGRRGAAGTTRGGGNNGSGGRYVAAWLPADMVPDTVTVTVGAGGAGGAAAGSDNTNGASGTAGTATTFGSLVRAPAGIGGAGGGVGTTGGGGASSTSFDAGDGGSGANIDSGNGTDDGNPGGTGAAFRGTVPTGGTEASGSTAAVAGGNVDVGEVAGGGGGGGGASNGSARAGAAGGRYGGGGGGGAASVNGTASGAGGTGGAGICVVVTVF